MNDLIVMRKDGATLEVHPSCVPDHQRMGWEVVTIEVSTKTPAPPTIAAKPKRAKAQP